MARLAYAEFFRFRRLPMLQTRHVVPIEILPGGTPICHASCRHEKECASHMSAGDFRSEDGFTPNLMARMGEWTCTKKPTESRGMLIWNGKKKVYESWGGIYGDN
jgi:hypothetical protein